MKTAFQLGCFAALAFSLSLAADEPRSADDILKDYDAIKMPTLDATKTRDQTYIREYLADRTQALEKQGVLAEELYKAHPDHPRAAQLMAMRLAQKLQSADYREAMPAVEDFVRANPKNELSPQLLMITAMREADKEKRLATYRRIVADYPSTRAAKTAAGQIRQVDGIGKPFDLAFTDAISDKPISMKGLEGKVVVIDFWATWCGPCVAEMPHMKELYAKFHDQGVEFIGISLDQPGDGLDKLKKFVEDKEIPWPQYYQGKGWESDFSASWGINSIPALFVIDAKGNLHSTEARGKLADVLPELIKKRDG
jgi:thiol-disulfide isomerase/thioredoxin